MTALSVSAGPSRVVKNEPRPRAQSVPVLRFVCLAGELTYVNVWLLLPAVDARYVTTIPREASKYSDGAALRKQGS